MNKTLAVLGYVQKRQPPVNNQDILFKEDFIWNEDILPNLYIYTLNNCYVSPYGIVLKDFKIVKASIYSMFHNENHYLTFLKKIILGKVRTISGKCAIAHNAYYSNYYHWCAETLPRLFLIKDLLSDTTLLLHEKVPTFVTEYLSFFGFKDVIFIKDDELIKADTLLLPMHTAGGLFHNGQIVSEMVSWLKTQVKSVYSKKWIGFENLYITRASAAYRRILNEKEVINLLKNYNFKIVDFENFSVTDQILLVSNAKNLIGIHGAGLGNIMYMPAGGLVIDLIHENHYDPAFYNLASSLKIDFILLQCKAANTDSRGVAYDNFTVDLNKLSNYLNNNLKNQT